MLTLIEKILFIAVVIVAVYFAFVGFRRVYRVVTRGPEPRPSLGDMGRRLLKAAGEWLGTVPIWQTRPWSSVFHIMISAGFVFYFLVNFADVLEGLFPITFLGEGFIGDVYRLLADLATMSVLIGVIFFLVRRFIAKDPALSYHDNVKLIEPVKNGAIKRDSLIVAFFILFHVGFRWLAQSFHVTLKGGMDPWQPFSSGLGMVWGGWPEPALEFGLHISWWLALGLILAFLPYFVYTKHFHLIMSGVNFLTKPARTSKATLIPDNFDDETRTEFGVSKIEQLPWTHLVDAYACIMCNRCQDVCPAYTTGKELSPSALEINKRYYLNGHLKAMAAGDPSQQTLLDYAISESAVWACTACAACVQICPVGNEPMFDILYMRRYQVLTEDSFPHELATAFRGMERNGNPWNMSARDRMKWTEGLDFEVPTVEDNPDFEILWWVGCAPSYDPRAQETARAFAKVLHAAGVSYAILGEMEQCTGDSARRAGNEFLFSEMAKANIETLNEFSPQRIVTTCPHCLQTLGKEYAQYGGAYNVIHHTQLLSELTAAKKISVARTKEVDMITFHDPCYLGRINGVLDAPRQGLLATNAFLVEMPRHGAHSSCCGAGGAQFWKEEEHGTARVNVTRYEEAAATGAKTIAVGCPFCLTMLTDASKGADQGIAVKDVVEIIASRLSANGAE
jgi:Fe-S oxidoreductase